jgi:hypothetical protein
MPRTPRIDLLLALWLVACTAPRFREDAGPPMKTSEDGGADSAEPTRAADASVDAAPSMDASPSIDAAADPCMNICDPDPAACSTAGGTPVCKCPLDFQGNGIGPEGCVPRLLFLQASPGQLSVANGEDRIESATLTVEPSTAQVTWIARGPDLAIIRLGANVLTPGVASVVRLASDAVSLDLVVEAGGASRSTPIRIERRDDVPTLSSKLYAANASNEDLFGNSVSVSGDWVAVGAPGEDGVPDDPSSDECTDSGAVYLFHRREDGMWKQEAYLKATPPIEGQLFGCSVALEGSRLVVGARFESVTPLHGESLQRAGAVYVFERDGGGQWLQRAQFHADEPASGEEFGHSVSLDGDRIAVGAPWLNASDDGSDPALRTGSVYILKRLTGGVWMREDRLVVEHAEADDQFGFSVSLSGGLLAIGAPGEDANGSSYADNSTSEAGAAYVMRRDELGKWRELAYLKSSDLGVGHRFGYAVALDGTHLAVAAPHSVLPGGPAGPVGATYVFEADDLAFHQVQKIGDVAAAGQQSPSESVALQGDVLIVGDIERSIMTGHAYMFRRDASGTWQERSAFPSTLNPEARTGFSVAVDGRVVVVGAPGDRIGVSATEMADHVGSARIFEY